MTEIKTEKRQKKESGHILGIAFYKEKRGTAEQDMSPEKVSAGWNTC